jgi:hypothetical protein
MIAVAQYWYLIKSLDYQNSLHNILTSNMISPPVQIIRAILDLELQEEDA